MRMVDVDLWTVCMMDLEPHSGTLIGLLSPPERRRADGLKSAARRREFMLTRGFVRSVLADYTGRDAASLELTTSDQGKPALAPVPGGSAIAFNVSHSKGSVALAVCDAGAVGVDIERIRSMPNASAMAAQYFTGSECRRLEEQGESAVRESLFLRFWTRKEALMKAHGGGLTIGVETICVDADLVPAGGVSRVIDGRNFTVTDCDVVPDCHICVAVEGAALTILVRETSTLLDRL